MGWVALYCKTLLRQISLNALFLSCFCFLKFNGSLVMSYLYHMKTKSYSESITGMGFHCKFIVFVFRCLEQVNKLVLPACVTIW